MKSLIPCSIILLILIPLSAYADSVLNLQIGSEKYVLGQNIVIQGNITLKPTDPKGLPITYELIDPNGNVIDSQAAQVGNNEFFITIHTGDGSKIGSVGTYGLIVYYGSPNPNLLNTPQSARVSFMVGSMPSPIGSSPNPSPTNQPISPQFNSGGWIIGGLVVMIIIAMIAKFRGKHKQETYSQGTYPLESLQRRGWTEIEKEQVRIRQNGKCSKCGRPPPRWEYHHRDGDRSNNSLRNCEGLCPNCHSVKTHDE